MQSSTTNKITFRLSVVDRFPRALALLSLCAASSLASATVTYTTTDLPDVVSGQDLWRYHYTVGAPLAAFNTVNLLFTPTLYSDLDVTGSSAGVSALVTQPDAGFSADGQVTVTALADILGTATETIDVDFVWLGTTGTPGSQRYELLDDQFSLLGSEQTRLAGSQLAPEPASLSLMMLGLLALPVLRRRSLSQTSG